MRSQTIAATFIMTTVHLFEVSHGATYRSRGTYVEEFEDPCVDVIEANEFYGDCCHLSDIDVDGKKKCKLTVAGEGSGCERTNKQYMEDCKMRGSCKSGFYVSVTYEDTEAVEQCPDSQEVRTSSEVDPSMPLDSNTHPDCIGLCKEGFEVTNPNAILPSNDGEEVTCKQYAEKFESPTLTNEQCEILRGSYVVAILMHGDICGCQAITPTITDVPVVPPTDTPIVAPTDDDDDFICPTGRRGVPMDNQILGEQCYLCQKDGFGLSCGVELSYPPLKFNYTPDGCGEVICPGKGNEPRPTDPSALRGARNF